MFGLDLKPSLLLIFFPFALHLIFKFIMPFVVKSKTDFDDIVLGILYKPLVMLASIFAFKEILFSYNISVVFNISVATIANVFNVLIMLYIIWRLIYQEFIGYYLVQLAEDTESGVDDILIPIVKVVFPIIYVIVGTIWLFNVLGINTAGWGVIVGGASFVLAFALQNILADIFAGIALLADTPFQKGDILRIGDQLLEVKKVGMRVTEFYVFEDHTTIFMANSKLAQEDIINLTYPTTDVRVHMKIGVAYGTNARLVKQILLDVAAANPYILGNPQEKVSAMRQKLGVWKKRKNEPGAKEEVEVLEWGIKKWSLEDRLLQLIETLRKKSFDLVKYIKTVEQDGLSEAELKRITGVLRNDMTPVVSDLISTMRAWKQVILKDPNLFPSDLPIIDKYWELKIKRLERHWKKVLHFVDSVNLSTAQRIDTVVEEFVDWLVTRFKDPYEPWKDPDVEFADFGDSAIVFEFEFFVDDIKSERYERLDRVQADILLAVYEAYAENNIEIPFPQRDVWFRNELVIKDKSSKKS